MPGRRPAVDAAAGFGFRPVPPDRPDQTNRIERKGLTVKACGVSGADGDVVLLELPEPPSDPCALTDNLAPTPGISD